MINSVIFIFENLNFHAKNCIKFVNSNSLTKYSENYVKFVNSNFTVEKLKNSVKFVNSRKFMNSNFTAKNVIFIFENSNFLPKN